MERRTYLVKRWLLRLVVTLMLLQYNQNILKASSAIEPIYNCFRIFSIPSIFSNESQNTKSIDASRENTNTKSNEISSSRKDVLTLSYNEAEASLEQKIQDQLAKLQFFESDKSKLMSSIDQLFIRKKILLNIKEFRDMLKHLIAELTKILQNEIRSNTVYKGAERTNNPINVWNIPFILENLDVVRSFSQDSLVPFLRMAPKGQVEKLFENLKTETKKRLLDRFETVAKSVYAVSYDMWVKSKYSDFTPQEEYIRETLLGTIKESLTTLLEEYKSRYSVFASLNIDELYRSLYLSHIQHILDRKESLSPIRYTVSNDSLSFEVPDLKIRGNFDPDLSSIYLYQTPESLDSSPNLLFLHGASTFTSNAASFVEIINRIKTSFYTDSVAIDLPGSMGDRGIVSNKISNPLEISIFLDKWFEKESSRRNGSNVAFGRSLGSTFAFANAFYNHVYKRPSHVDMYMLTSFSNPFTMDYQLQAVQELAQQDSSVTLVPGFEEHLMSFTNAFKRDLITIKENNPELISSFGYNILFVQGEADADGGPNVLPDLHSYIDSFAPNASTYEVMDPLKENPEIAKIFGSDNKEASHFLLNGRANADVRHLNIPEEFAPKFFDQSLEIMVLQRAWLDFMIDLSPFVTDTVRSSLLEKRIRYTGSNEKFAYFKKILADLSKDLPERSNIEVNLDLDHIINGTADTHVQTIETRIKKIIDFIDQEYRRQKSDAGIVNDITLATILLQ